MYELYRPDEWKWWRYRRVEDALTFLKIDSQLIEQYLLICARTIRIESLKAYRIMQRDPKSPV